MDGHSEFLIDKNVVRISDILKGSAFIVPNYN